MTSPLNNNQSEKSQAASFVEEVESFESELDYQIVRAREDFKDRVDDATDRLNDFHEHEANLLRDAAATLNSYVGVDGVAEWQETIIAGRAEFKQFQNELVGDVIKEGSNIATFLTRERLSDGADLVTVVPKIVHTIESIPEDPTVIPVGEQLVIEGDASLDLYAGLGLGVSGGGSIKLSRPAEDEFVLELAANRSLSGGIGVGASEMKMSASAYVEQGGSLTLKGDTATFRELFEGDFSAIERMEVVGKVTGDIGVAADVADVINVETGVKVTHGVERSEAGYSYLGGGAGYHNVSGSLSPLGTPVGKPLEASGGVEVGTEWSVGARNSANAYVEGSGSFRGDEGKARVSVGTDGATLTTETSVPTSTWMETDLPVGGFKAGNREITNSEFRL